MKPGELLMLALAKPKLPEWPEAADPREDWRCGTCAYWKKEAIDHSPALGLCRNRAAMIRVLRRVDGRPNFAELTMEDFGCRFWSAKPLEDKGADIPIAFHNAGSPT